MNAEANPRVCIAGRWVPAVPMRAPIDVRWVCEHEWTPHVFPNGHESTIDYDCLNCGTAREFGAWPERPRSAAVVDRRAPLGVRTRATAGRLVMADLAVLFNQLTEARNTVLAGVMATQPHNSACQTCGYPTRNGPAEYHPYAFCVLVKAGLDPWETARTLARDLAPFDDLDRPPRVDHVQAARR